MHRRHTSLPTKSTVRRFRVAMYVCAFVAVIPGASALLAGEFAYPSRFGLGSPAFLIAFGLFFLAIGIFWRPRTRD